MPLQVGDNATDQFNFTVTDSLGRSQTTTLTFNVAGTDDAPIITGGRLHRHDDRRRRTDRSSSMAASRPAT